MTNTSKIWNECCRTCVFFNTERTNTEAPKKRKEKNSKQENISRTCFGINNRILDKTFVLMRLGHGKFKKIEIFKRFSLQLYSMWSLVRDFSERDVIFAR